LLQKDIFVFVKNIDMSANVINTSNAPAPIGPYSQAISTGNLLFVSGQIALNPATQNIDAENITDETKQVMSNLLAILKQAGMDFKNIVKTTIYLSDMSLFGDVNAVYATYFTENFPARETVAVKGLPKNVNVEISVIAAL